MDVRTYRAKTMQEALAQVRGDLGPQAAVLHTREVRRGWWRWLTGRSEIEIVASSAVNVPSRLAPAAAAPPAPPALAPRTPIPPAHEEDYRSRYRDDLRNQLDHLHSMVEQLCKQKEKSQGQDVPESLFHLFTDLIDAEVSEDLARELLEKVRGGGGVADLTDPVLLKARMARLIEEEIKVCGPIQTSPRQRRIVALIGPTGVGKTTTIAKLAANYHLREQRRVGLITVDTYRIAAVEQLRTYADIIDLPMEVVSTPREMRAAVERLADLDLILLDTAGRSPRDDVKIQELKSMLGEARADEVHLVLSSVSSMASLKKTAKKFTEAGATAIVLTKLDEATGLGNLLPLLRSCGLPLSYVTNGQNVPDDIEPADRRKLARIVLGMEAMA
jgi:flagellar biosynthesis protein FlhF